ncbi:MAG: hypothetical protein MJ236_06930, partial [Clostridia bacterium]|nr:hypothetical protein [Clostridia bacterium]
MKNKKLLVSLSILFGLTACNGLNFGNTQNTPNKGGEIKEHEHTYSSEWSFDDNNHWHDATCEHTERKSGLLLHNFTDWATIVEPTIYSPGTKSKKCMTCGFSISETIPQKSLNGLTIDKPFSLDEAIEEMADYSRNEVSKEMYYVTGKVGSFTHDETRDVYTIYFEGHEFESTDPFQIYLGAIDLTYVPDSFFPSDLDGATITVYGYLEKYYNINYQKIVYEVASLNANYSPTGYQVFPKIVFVSTVDEAPHAHTFDTKWTYDNSYHWHETNCGHSGIVFNKESHTFGSWVFDIEATETTQGLKHRECLTCGYKEESIIAPITKGDGTFTLYTFNDFHGAVNEYSSSGHVGLAKFGTFLKQASDNENVLIVDSGDTFQGSIESNYNNGALITDVFNYAHVDVHTLGNHDFDWGEDKIES